MYVCMYAFGFRLVGGDESGYTPSLSLSMFVFLS